MIACIFAARGPAWSQAPSDDEPAPSPTELLEQFAAEIDDFKADFEQRLFDVDGELIETSTGQFSLLRPDRFLWHYDTPFEQQVIADGEFIWMYDVEVETVTRAPISDLDDSPAMLLSGRGTVGESFVVGELPSADGSRLIELRPVDGADSEFIAARIEFRDGLPVALELVDDFEQVTQIEFANVDVNSGLQADVFEFDPPAGVHVVGDDD